MADDTSRRECSPAGTPPFTSRSFLSLVLGGLVLLLPATSHAADYYVDGESLGGPCSDTSPGDSMAAPWCTIGQANATLRPGDTVHIREAQYNEVISPSVSGEPGQEIVYVAFTGETPTIGGRPDETCVVNIRSDHIVVDSLRIQHTYPEAFDGERFLLVCIHGSEYNTIRNSTILGMSEDVEADFAARVRLGGIQIAQGRHNLIDNNTIRNISFIGIHTGLGSQLNVIRDNVISNVLQDCVHIGGRGEPEMLGLLIENNLIEGSTRSDGVQANGCVGVPASSDPIAGACLGGVVVRNNILRNHAENAIDLKGTYNWVIEGNIIYGIMGNNDGGRRARPRYDCDTPPCNNMTGGTSITRGANTQTRNVIIRHNVIFDGHGGVPVFDNFHVFNNTMLNNRRTWEGSNQASCYTDSCSRKAGFPAVYWGGPNDSATLLNNISGDSGHDIVGVGGGWHVDSNLYYSTWKDPYRGFVVARGIRDWDVHTLPDWRDYLRSQSWVTGDEENSHVTTGPDAVFRNVPPEVTGDHELFDFRLSATSPAIDAGGFLTTAVGSATDSTLLDVRDAKFFFDGFGITEGDLIVVGANDPVRIVSGGMSGTDNVLTLDRALTWSAGDPVSLPYQGAGPDVGAYEYGDEPCVGACDVDAGPGGLDGGPGVADGGGADGGPGGDTDAGVMGGDGGVGDPGDGGCNCNLVRRATSVPSGFAALMALCGFVWIGRRRA